MTDEEIIELAEKTRRSKYCGKFCYKQQPDYANPYLRDDYCEKDCPVAVLHDYLFCEDDIYDTGFLDGFKESMIKFQEEIKRLYAQNEKDYEDYNDDNIYGGYTHALEHMETFINS